MRGVSLSPSTGRLSISLCVAIALATGTTASAQTTGRETTKVEPLIEEITVTARKREETALEVPLSVSAFSLEKIEEAALFDTSDIARMTPGFNMNEQGNYWAGRLYPQLFFRGMSVLNPVPKDQIGALFIDGVYYLGAPTSLNTFDVERVEVLKGPQNAYFGRNTFGGAINFIMRTPTGEQRTNVMTDVTHEGSYKASLGNEGTIIPDKLLYRVSVGKYHRAPQFTAQDGGKLGEQNSTNLALTLFATPTDRLKARLRVQFGEDEDGAPAAAYLPGVKYDTCGGNVPYSRYSESGERVTLYPSRFFCGEIPSIDTLGKSIVSRNTSLNSPMLAARGYPNMLRDIFVHKNFEPYLSTNADPRIIGLARDLLDKVPDLDGFGLHRKYWLTSLSVDYELTDALVLSGLFGYNRAATAEAGDNDGQDLEAQMQLNGNLSVDKSAELRLSWDNGGPLTAMVGVNYYEQSYDGSFTGVLSIRPGSPTIVALNGNTAGSRSEVLGVFGAIHYTFLDDFRFTLEGRYQEDELVRTGNALDPEKVKFTDFLPRVILSWQPVGSSTNVYASYAKGVIPGQYNAALIDPTIPPSERERIAAQTGAVEVLDSEELDSYELGWKQRFLGGRAYLNLAIYTMEWRGQKLTAAIPVTLVDGGTSNRSVYVPADIDLKGFELEAGWRPTNWLELEGTLNWTDSEYVRGLDNNTRTLTGSANMKGLRTARFPEWSGSLSGTLSGGLQGTDWEWFSRLDVMYTGKQYSDPANLAYIDDYITANLRAGLRKSGWRIEAYASNLTDENTWLGGARFINLVDNSQGLMMIPMREREIGLRISVDL